MRNLFGTAFGILLLVGVMLAATKFFGEDAFWCIWIGAGTLLLITALCARSYDPAEVEHKARVKRAKELREERRKNGLKW